MNSREPNIMRRIRQLEEVSESQRNGSGQTPADVLRERIRRIAEADGVPYVEAPRGRLTDDRGRQLSVAEILRQGNPLVT